jgi:hypothetical protein
MDYFYDKLAFYRKLVKNTSESDRLRWLKSIDNLKSQPQHFWKYISDFRSYKSVSVKPEVDSVHVVEPSAVADGFTKYFNCS